MVKSTDDTRGEGVYMQGGRDQWSVPALEPAPALVEDRVTERLRAMIASGDIPEETRLRHRDLAAQLGVSPTPIRNALNRLALDGFVELDRRGRTYTSALSFEDLEELTAARIGLEGLAVRLGAAHVTDDDIVNMQSHLESMRTLADTSQIKLYLQYRWRFHSTCYLAAGRPQLVAKVERLFLSAERYNVRLLRLPRAQQESLGHYASLLDAVSSRDGEAAERAFVRSALWAVDRLRAGLPPRSARPN